MMMNVTMCKNCKHLYADETPCMCSVLAVIEAAKTWRAMLYKPNESNYVEDDLAYAVDALEDEL